MDKARNEKLKAISAKLETIGLEIINVSMEEVNEMEVRAALGLKSEMIYALGLTASLDDLGMVVKILKAMTKMKDAADKKDEAEAMVKADNP